MVGNVGMHRTDYRDIIDVLTDMREQLAHFDAALAVFFELERGLERGAGATLSCQVIHWQGPAIQSRERGFRIERVHMRWAAIGENMDYSFSLGGKWRRLGGQRGGAHAGLRLSAKGPEKVG